MKVGSECKLVVWWVIAGLNSIIWRDLWPIGTIHVWIASISILEILQSGVIFLHKRVRFKVNFTQKLIINKWELLLVSIQVPILDSQATNHKIVSKQSMELRLELPWKLGLEEWDLWSNSLSSVWEWSFNCYLLVQKSWQVGQTYNPVVENSFD